MNEARKLPLWKSWVENVGQALSYGSHIDAPGLAEYLGNNQDSIHFASDMIEIRKWFRGRGMVLTARGCGGSGFRIEFPEDNWREIRRKAKSSINALRAGVSIGENTNTLEMSPEAKRRHESVTERMQIRMALIGRKIPATQGVRELSQASRA